MVVFTLCVLHQAPTSSSNALRSTWLQLPETTHDGLIESLLKHSSERGLRIMEDMGNGQ